MNECYLWVLETNHLPIYWDKCDRWNKYAGVTHRERLKETKRQRNGIELDRDGVGRKVVGVWERKGKEGGRHKYWQCGRNTFKGERCSSTYRMYGYAGREENNSWGVDWVVLQDCRESERYLERENGRESAWERECVRKRDREGIKSVK